MTKAEIEKRITEMEQELDSLKKQLNEPEKKTGWEKPEKNQVYQYISRDGQVNNFDWDGGSEDSKQYDCGNCFTSKELAENIARYQSLDLRIRRRIAEICEPLDWKDWNDRKQNKYYFYYHHVNKTIMVGSFSYTEQAMWWFDTNEHAEQIIEEFKDELTWYFTEFKDRMDG